MIRTPRRVTRADLAQPLPATVEAVLAAPPEDAFERIVELVDAISDEDERDRVLAVACVRLGLTRE